MKINKGLECSKGFEASW